jgi:hypothetical protein
MSTNAWMLPIEGLIMNENEKTLFELGTIALGLGIALTATLRRLHTELGPRASIEMKQLEEIYIRDIKNFTPDGPVPDEIMQSGVGKLIAQVRSAFEQARNG